MRPECPPILFLIFNRPDTTEKVFSAIRSAKPSKLYVAADAARTHNATEQQRCQESKLVTEKLDWNCEVHRLYQETNLGCGKAVSTAISWFFAHEDSGIILEDDCVPHSDFFPYCAQLLEYYKDNQEIGIISGDHFQHKDFPKPASYYFSKYANIWGWATWKRTWEKFQLDVNQFDQKAMQTAIQKRCNHRSERTFWLKLFKRMQNHEIDTWDYPLQFSLWFHQMICIIPNYNLVSNCGFDSRATHTKSSSTLSNLETYPILPLVHPKRIEVNHRADSFFFNTHVCPRTPITFHRIWHSVKRRLFKND